MPSYTQISYPIFCWANRRNNSATLHNTRMFQSNEREVFGGSIIRHSLWPSSAPDFQKLWLSFMGKFKRQCLENKSPHYGKIMKQHPPRDFNNFWERMPELTKCSTSILNACGQEGNNFCICCSTGEFSPNFLEVIITANPSCHLASWDMAHNTTLPNCQPALIGQPRKNTFYYVFTPHI